MFIPRFSFFHFLLILFNDCAASVAWIWLWIGSVWPWGFYRIVLAQSPIIILLTIYGTYLDSLIHRNMNVLLTFTGNLHLSYLYQTVVVRCP